MYPIVQIAPVFISQIPLVTHGPKWAFVIDSIILFSGVFGGR
jgi:hypothetical protein